MLVTGDPVESVRARRGGFVEMFRAALAPVWGGRLEAYDAREGRLPALEGHDALVITGSPASVTAREPWMLEAEAWLREVVAAGHPTLGVCFGHQLLAQALGGEVAQNPRGREIGTHPVELHPDAEGEWLFEGLPRAFEVNLTHVDTVARLPEGAVALARSERDDHQAIRFSEACFGVQFHPEVDADIMRGYVEARREVLLREGFEVGTLLARVGDAEPGREILRRFVLRFG